MACSGSSHSTSARWAVLVGIDHYSDSDPRRNLNGCANDALLVRDCLLGSLCFLESNIRLHLASTPPGDATHATPDPPSTKPSKTNIISSLNEVRDLASQGDFLLIHFSGHGDRRPTTFPERKTPLGQDELLCLVEGESWEDVEFGEKLDELSQKLTVLVFLDCCFSGGATRQGHEYCVRHNPRDLEVEPGTASANFVQGDQCSQVLSDNNSGILRGTRNATASDSWLYRERAYTVITSCQPFEEAKEKPIASRSNKWYGLMTSCLIQELTSLSPNFTDITYSSLHEILVAKVSEQLKFGGSGPQRPMLIGKRNRILFESRLQDTKSSDTSTVLRSENGIITLNRGEISGVSIGDVYHVHHSGHNHVGKKFTEAIITSVSEFSAKASLTSMARTSLGDGHSYEEFRAGSVAKLQRRDNSSLVRFLLRPGQAQMEAVQDVKDNWQSFVDPITPLNFAFEELSDDRQYPEAARFLIQLGQEGFIFLDTNAKPFEHLPAFPANAESLTKRIVANLAHLQHFLLFRELKTPKLNGSSKPRVEVKCTELPDSEKTEAIRSSWSIEIRNQHARPIFVTVFNLTPLYGVYQLFPHRASGTSIAIQSGDNWPPQELDIEIPESLRGVCSEPSFVMTDMFKVFVCTEQVDLTHWELEDITSNQAQEYRHANARVQSQLPWFVEDFVIVTDANTSTKKAV